jgi:hypothetical protein
MVGVLWLRSMAKYVLRFIKKIGKILVISTLYYTRILMDNLRDCVIHFADSVLVVSKPMLVKLYFNL